MSSFQKCLSIVILSGVFLFIMWLVIVVNIFSRDMGRSIESAYNFYSRNPHFGGIHSFLLNHVEGIFWGISIALLIQVAMILLGITIKRGNNEVMEYNRFLGSWQLATLTKESIREFDDKEGDEMTSQQYTYESWSNEDLIRATTVDRQDYLPEAMIMIEAELKRRNVSLDDRTHIEQQILSGMKRASRPLKTKWLRVWNYLLLPLSGINNIYSAVTISDIPTSLLAFIFAIIQLATAFGLYHRKLWAWTLNWVALLLSYYAGVTLPIFLKRAYGVEQTFNDTIFGMIIFALIWLWPNYVYWKKRKELFIK